MGGPPGARTRNTVAGTQREVSRSHRTQSADAIDDGHALAAKRRRFVQPTRGSVAAALIHYPVNSLGHDGRLFHVDFVTGVHPFELAWGPAGGVGLLEGDDGFRVLRTELGPVAPRCLLGR